MNTQLSLTDLSVRMASVLKNMKPGDKVEIRMAEHGNVTISLTSFTMEQYLLIGALDIPSKRPKNWATEEV